MTDHPITPPPELVQQWRAAASNVPASLSTDPGGRRDYIDYIATQAARWGADQELVACFEWAAEQNRGFDLELRAARRPKPPSLKKQALDGLQRIETNIPQSLKEFEASYDVIRRALEALDD